MTEKKRKNRDQSDPRNRKDRDFNKKRKNLSSKRKEKKEDMEKRKRCGPHLPNALRKELDFLNPTTEAGSDEDIDSDEDVVGNDVYEYEEGVPEEESKKNKRYDPVDNYEYELPEDFEDENVASDEGEDDEDANNQEENDKRHARMLQGVTGLPVDAFEGKKKKGNLIVSEAYPESEYNPSRDIIDGDGRISIQDLLDPLHGKSGFSKLRKSTHQMEKSMPILAPLPKPEQERLERKAAYEQSKKDITRWEPLVKRNREAPTLYFDEDVDLGFSTVGAIASEFEPRTEFEKRMASLINDNEVVDAHQKDGARLLELNKIPIEEVKDRQNRLAKLRSLLFRHEMKAKRVKKIKSKTYHRLLKKDRSKAFQADISMDPEAAKEFAMKQEFKRAEERMRQKHKNRSKWAQRILERGLDVQDEGTRAAFAEQLNQHALLTRKMNSMKESSSDESNGEDDTDYTSAGSDQDMSSKLLAKAKEKTLEVLEDDEELPKSGVLSLPFMVRGLKKREEEARKEAELTLDEYEASLKQLEDGSEILTQENGTLSGRRTFGTSQKPIQKPSKKTKSENFRDDSDDDIEENEDGGDDVSELPRREVNVDPDILRQALEIEHDPVVKGFEDNAGNSGPKTTFEVTLFASDSWKKVNNSSDGNQCMRVGDGDVRKPQFAEPKNHDQFVEEESDGSDTDSAEQMVDGDLTSAAKASYKLPSQEELIRRAFASDDVEDEFRKEKEAILNEENPEPEKPVLLPGWGQWTNVQKKKGLPSWMLEEHEIAKKKRDEALKKRKDAHLNHVIISEKLDKKAEKLYTKTLPYPYTSKEVFEQSIRMPIGPEFNPATAIGALNRPEVVKKPGVIIKPITFEDVNHHERSEKHGGGKKKGKDKSRSTKAKK